MSLYGHRNISHDSLKRWCQSLSPDTISAVDIGGDVIELTEDYKEILRKQTAAFSELLEKLKPEDDWRSLQGVLSPLFYNAFIRINDNAIRIGDYYECLITPSNVKTSKRIIKGFDYLSIGAIHIHDNDNQVIGTIGMKSDLLWSVFYDYFMYEGPDGSIKHAYSNHEMYMSLQLFDVEELTNEEIDTIVNELLLRVSVEHNLDFELVRLDPEYKIEGSDTIYNMQFTTLEYEKVPAFYLSTAFHAKDVRLSYLCYYQVLEYFFVRAQNYNFLEEYNALTSAPVNHSDLRKVLRNYHTSTNEQNSLKLVLKRSVDIPQLKDWLNKDASRVSKYCGEEKPGLDLSKSDHVIISRLAERIYGYRCAIAHAKGDADMFMAIPTIHDADVYKEIELIRYIAYETLKNCSEL